MSDSVHYTDVDYMKLALEEANIAFQNGDVPVGAVLVSNETGEILARGHNTRELMQNALGHAEIRVIDQACTAVSSWRLSNCTLYVTLEPCPMCAGAILNGRISRVVYGTKDPVAGAMGSIWALHRHPVQTSHTIVEYGCMEEKCREVLQEFFKKRRETKS